ncbi:acyltransferase family protein [Parasedimentitalea psychrophila]|uniref:Acyltransferase family protein n=1 Tax=Parasedimentitalea psychrophila TaxID=2997337 RepID=A0A9Y2KZG1_9RHOB|nr:acyltransferase family protein [Parasedimentitalea psychrophila]WIY24562.1 acyltransferase family protein [Parasedimentitalea psychrophila]
MNYRPEIDGLRALAVVPVVLSHAGLAFFSGGYVGVDIFFVISGYLITGILLRELQNGNFSFLNFYERRARRILPALFFVIFCSVPFALLWMPPSQLMDYSRSLAAVMLFVSNVHFWETAGYFGLDAALKPLLHTWSLAVEEQFYMLFPMLLVLTKRWSIRQKLTGLLVLAALSLSLSEWGWRNEPEANFYFTFSRFWELLSGAITAVAMHDKRPSSNNSLAVIGLILILFSITVFDEKTPFPSIYTLVPVLGAMLLLRFAHRGTFVAQILSLRPIIGIGLISYSAYLWHQPLLAFARIRSIIEPNPFFMIFLAGFSFALAYLSWRFVEKPFRRGPVPALPGKPLFLGTSSIIIIFLVSIGLYGESQKGFINHYNDAQQAVLSSVGHTEIDAASIKGCLLHIDETIADFNPECLNPKADILIVGDSHAAALTSGLRLHYSISQFNVAGCPPLLDYVNSTRPNCARLNLKLPGIIADLQPTLIILHANWKHYDLGDLVGLGMMLDQFQSASPETRIMILGGVPQWPPSLPERLVMYDDPLAETRWLLTKLAGIREIDLKLAVIARSRGALYQSLVEDLCNEDYCLATVPQQIGSGRSPMAWDYGHLTFDGSIYIVKSILASVIARLVS